MIESVELFPHLNEFCHRSLIEDAPLPFDALKNLGPYLQSFLEKSAGDARQLDSLEGLTFTDGSEDFDAGIFVNKWILFEKATYFPRLEIYLGAGTRLEPSAILKGPCVIGEDCDIRQGAYLRGNILTGNHCTLGHATEIKNSILMNHTEAGHFNYIGDSILGSYVNLGAGTKIANLQFRSDEEKLKGFIHNIQVPGKQGEVDTGLNKLGSIVGDHVELGCNAVLSPGVMLGAHVWVYPNFTVPKGVYTPRQILLPRDIKPRNKTR